MSKKHSLPHNNREFLCENVDPTRTKDNITIIKDDIGQVYHELFDKALIEYNAKQKRKDRIIKDYHEHIRHSRQEQEYHEVIFQIGNQDDTPCGSDMGKVETELLREFAESFQARNPHLRVFNEVIHLDEATPHIHIDFVPFATEQKRGLSTRVSLTKALEQQGFKGEGEADDCFTAKGNQRVEE
ncbi:MAG: plasmid recombination protein [Oscillospiraceae bacterium]|nr:plasmid recombination protein [Oscillospiraceae bacterium]